MSHSCTPVISEYILSISDVCAAGEDLRDVGSVSTNVKGYVASWLRSAELFRTICYSKLLLISHIWRFPRKMAWRICYEGLSFVKRGSHSLEGDVWYEWRTESEKAGIEVSMWNRDWCVRRGVQEWNSHSDDSRAFTTWKSSANRRSRTNTLLSWPY
jgi:hypothetical protein